MPGKKHPLGESLEENSEPHAKRQRFENVVLLRPTRRRRRTNNGGNGNNTSIVSPQRTLRAGKRKKPSTEGEVVANPIATSSQSQPETDENDIISELTKEFKKARLRPVFFTISSFIEQTVDEVGFTMADEPADVEVTVRLNFFKNNHPTMSSSTTDEEGINETEKQKENSPKEGTDVNVSGNTSSLIHPTQFANLDQNMEKVSSNINAKLQASVEFSDNLMTKQK